MSFFCFSFPDLYPDVCFRWSQTEDPLVVPGQEIPKGFVYKEGPQPKYHGFFGLSRSTRQNCLLDADLSSPTRWWFALGTFKSFRGADTFPGPDEIVVSLVELYIELWPKKQKLRIKIKLAFPKEMVKMWPWSLSYCIFAYTITGCFKGKGTASYIIRNSYLFLVFIAHISVKQVKYLF